MVIVSGTYGQFCNQLFRLGHHIANGLRYGYVVNCADFEHRHLFANLTQHELVTDVPVLSGWQQKLLRLSTRQPFQSPMRWLFQQQGYAVLDRPCLFDQSNTPFLTQATHRQLLVTNWGFRDFDSFNSQHTVIKHLFTLPDSTLNEASQLVAEARQLGDVVVGVHLRRGDYAQWHNGQYYYSDAVYAAVMAHLTSLMPDRRVAFLLCSNEPLDQAAFTSWPTVVSTKSFTTDLAAFSQCDLLVGPPSTFSLWASFIGQVPHYHLQTTLDRPLLTDFSVAKG